MILGGLRRSFAAEPRRAPLLRRAAQLNFALGVLFAAVFVYFAFRARFTVPYIDDWSWLASLQDHPFTNGLWQPHNEHIIVIPRLLLWMDFWIWGWPGYATLIAALLSHAAIAGVLIRTCRDRNRNRHEALLLSGTVLVLTFLTYQLQEAVFPSSVLFPLVTAFAMLAIACLAECAASTSETSIARCTALSALMTVLAMLCQTNGLVLPFILAALSWVLPVPRRTMMMFVVLGIAGLAARHALGGVPGTVLTAPVSSIVRFGLAMLAGPIAVVSPQLAVLAGGCAGIGALWALRQFARRMPSAADSVLIGSILFVLASVAMASLGRAQFDLSVAASSRYTGFATVGWASLLLFAWPPNALSSRIGKVAGILLPAASLAALPIQLFIGRVWVASAHHLDSAGVMLAVGVRDDDWAWRIHPLGAPYIDPVLSQLRARDVTFLRFPELGRETQHLAGAAAACDGSVEAVDPREASTGLRVHGRLRERGERLLIVDREARVRGLAKPAPAVQHARASANDLVWAEFDRLAERGTTNGWLGFAAWGAGPPFRAELLDGEGRLVCEAQITCCTEPQEAPSRQELIVKGGLPEGWLDAAGCTTIAGWAWDSTRPGEPQEVRIEISNGQELTIPADGFRPDLLEHGKGGGRHGFVVGPPQLKLGPGTWQVSASIAETGVPLTGSPKTVMCPE